MCQVDFTETRLFDIDRTELSPVHGPHAEIIIGEQTGWEPVAALRSTFYNHPNPFNPTTVFVLMLPQARGVPDATPVAVDVFSVSGSHVRSCFRGSMSAGRHELTWDGKDDSGKTLAAGVYIGVARTMYGVLHTKMILIR
jgi:hypothetical protein